MTTDMRTGGGETPLTAELCARAIVAAAKAYGDDPVRACIVQRGPPRRCMTPAAKALADFSGASFKRVATILGIRKQNYSRAKAGPGFDAAERAARRALGFACGGVVAPDSLGLVGEQPSERRLAPRGRPAPVIPPRTAPTASPRVPIPDPPSPPAAEPVLSDEDRRHLLQISAALGSGVGFPILNIGGRR